VSNQVRELCIITVLRDLLWCAYDFLKILLSWYLSVRTHETCKQSVSIELLWNGAKNDTGYVQNTTC
jgi:hypothetical protein